MLGSLTGADILATTGSLNDYTTAAATVISETGADLTGLAGKMARGSPYIAAPIAVGTLANGYTSGNSAQEYDGGFGLTTLAASVVSGPLGLGMALGKVVLDAAGLEDINHSDPNILEEAALAAPATECPAHK